MGHHHQHHDHGDLKGKKLGISIILNLLITIAQIIGGLISGSLALLSDALHNFSDVISLVISYIADRLTQKQSTPQQTFGYKRAEILAAMINAATLLVIAVLLVKEAVIRLQQPEPVDSLWVIVLAASKHILIFRTISKSVKQPRFSINFVRCCENSSALPIQCCNKNLMLMMQKR